jgi:hypothetical protein
MSKPLKEQCVTLVENPWMYEAVLVLEPDEHGARPIVFQGRLEVAERLMSCWNIQLGVDTPNITRKPRGPNEMQHL